MDERGAAPRFALADARHVLIVGGSGAIATALVDALAAEPSRRIYVTTRRAPSDPPPASAAASRASITFLEADPLVEAHLAHVAARLTADVGSLDLLINCAGVLHDAACRPEKSLAQIDLTALQHIFAVNSFIAPLLAKHMLPLFKRSPSSVFVSLSAKVGSIGDNRSGGWYGYRASKAALNMMMKTIALEYEHRHCPTIVVPLHPGTTRSPLSQPYTTASTPNLHSAAETAGHLLRVIDGLTRADSGTFCNWDGSKLPW